MPFSKKPSRRADGRELMLAAASGRRSFGKRLAHGPSSTSSLTTTTPPLPNHNIPPWETRPILYRTSTNLYIFQSRVKLPSLSEIAGNRRFGAWKRYATQTGSRNAEILWRNLNDLRVSSLSRSRRIFCGGIGGRKAGRAGSPNAPTMGSGSGVPADGGAFSRVAIGGRRRTGRFGGCLFRWRGRRRRRRDRIGGLVPPG